jgi:hypothetical protein
METGADGSVDGWGAMLQAESSRIRVPISSLNFFHFTCYFQPPHSVCIETPWPLVHKRTIPTERP